MVWGNENTPISFAQQLQRLYCVQCTSTNQLQRCPWHINYKVSVALQLHDFCDVCMLKTNYIARVMCIVFQQQDIFAVYDKWTELLFTPYWTLQFMWYILQVKLLYINYMDSAKCGVHMIILMQRGANDSILPNTHQYYWRFQFSKTRGKFCIAFMAHATDKRIWMS